MFNIVPHTLWVLCVHQHKVTSDWNVKLSLGITVLAASENLISSCFWLSHSHFPHSHSCANKDIGNTGLGRDFFFFLTQKLKRGGAGPWWLRHLTERSWERSHGFRGSAPVWSLGGKVRPLPRELMRFLMHGRWSSGWNGRSQGRSVTFRGQPSVAYFCHASPTSWRLHSLPQGQHPMRAKHSKH